MHTPTPWDDDPACGHLVAHPHQTHYCTYERVPRLLSLERSLTDHPDELWALRLLQAFELWLLVLTRDLTEVLGSNAAESAAQAERRKHLRRGAALLELLERQTELAHSFLLQDLGLRLPLKPPPEGTASPGLARSRELVQQLGQEIGSRGEDQPEHPAAKLLRLFYVWAPRFATLLDGLLEPDSGADLAYADYIQLQELGSLQSGVKAKWAPADEPPPGIAPTERVSSDELMFIVVHQAFELWFNVLLHDLDAVCAALKEEPADLKEAIRRMQRVVPAQRMLIDQIHMPATMRPLDFLQFRNQSRVVDGVTYVRGLSPASGTESYQFREIEILGGLAGSKAYLELLRGNDDMHIRFMTPKHRTRMEQANLPELFEEVLRRRGIQDVIEVYQPRAGRGARPELAELADLLLQFDEFFQLWRVNHLVMVQSMIGRKSGTGFLGPEYLQETVGMGAKGGQKRLLEQQQTRPRFFEQLWEARTRFKQETEHEQA